MKRNLLMLCALSLCMMQSWAQITVQHDILGQLQALMMDPQKEKSDTKCYAIANCYHSLNMPEREITWHKKARIINPSLDNQIEEGLAHMKIGAYNDAIISFKGSKHPKSQHYQNMAIWAQQQIQQNGINSIETIVQNTAKHEFAAFTLDNNLLFGAEVSQLSMDVEAKNIHQDADGYTLTDASKSLWIKGQNASDDMLPCHINNDVIAMTHHFNPEYGLEGRANAYISLAQYKIHTIAEDQLLLTNGITCSDPYIDAANNRVYFTSNMEGGQGGYDLYYKDMTNGEIVNLGNEINTAGDEISPSLDSKGNLYFASNHHFGFGGFDIFKAQKFLNDFIDPQNMGLGVNSSFDESFPHVTNQGLLYFTSNRPTSQGKNDIYYYQIPQRDITFTVGETQAIASSNTNTDNTPADIIIEAEEDIPAAVYIGDYQPRINLDLTPLEVEEPATVVSQTSKIDIKLNPVIISEDIAYQPNEEVADLVPPPAFKIPNLSQRSTTSENERASTVSYEGARLVSVGEVIAKQVNNVYFIQVAALYSNSNDYTKYIALGAVGNVYKVFVGRATKIRVGYFYDHEEATDVLTKVRNMGFKDAFMVNDALNTDNLELITSKVAPMHSQSNYTAPSSSQKSPIETGNFEYNVPLQKSAGSKYKVRLASYEDPIWFDASKVKDLGQLEQWSKGSWTIFILSGYSNFDDAYKAAISAINRGYADAEVVIDNDGIIERLKKN